MGCNVGDAAARLGCRFCFIRYGVRPAGSNVWALAQEGRVSMINPILEKPEIAINYSRPRPLIRLWDEKGFRHAKETGARRVMLVDGSSTFRAGFAKALKTERDLTVAGQTGTAEEALQLAKTLPADVAMVDVHLPDGSGIEVCRQLIAGGNVTSVVMMANVDWDIYLAGAWSAGASGLVLKNWETRRLIWAARQASNVHLFTPEQLQRIHTWGRTVGDRLVALGTRELQVLRLLAAGTPNREIAQQLVLSESTVAKHISSLFRKTGARSRTALLAFVLQNHLDVADGPKQWPKSRSFSTLARTFIALSI